VAAGLVGLVAVAGATGGLVGARVADDAPPATTGAATAVPLVSASGTPATLDVGAVLAAVEGAVADIQATGPRQSGQGTGIVYSADGLVLTNNHVVEGATTVTVTTPGDRQPRAATIVGTDPNNDVAVLRLSNTDGLTVAQLGSSATTKVGEDVVAIGNALGLRGDPSVTRGIVSALDRSIGDLSGLIQTDAAINSGNSGGPLVNAAGQVIGINTAVAIENNAQNIGFAIPIDTAKAVAERLTDGTPTTPTAFLGVSTMDNTAGTTGATIAEVTAGSPAAKAGLQAGDVIVAVGGHAVSGAASLSRLVGDQEPGDKVDLTIVRQGTERHVEAVLGQR
jgi:putative serine protease PepD